MILDSVALFLGYTVMIVGGISLVPIFIYFTADEAIRSVYGMPLILEFVWWQREQKKKAQKKDEEDLT